MINIILGKDTEFSGKVNQKCSICYLPQYYNYSEEQTVEEFLTEKTYNYDEFLKLMNKFGFEVYFLDRNLFRRLYRAAVFRSSSFNSKCRNF